MRKTFNCKANENLQSKASDGYLSVCVLASGSKGNSIFISDGNANILIDAGLPGSEIERRLKSKGLSPADLDGILVSHEHEDHIRGVGVLSRRFDLPVYMSQKTAQAGASRLGKIHDAMMRHFECGAEFAINSLKIRPFSLSHDAKDPAGFTVRQNGTKIGIATDLGIATNMVKTHLKDCALLILEANHDPEMLMNGPYPWYLKQRVRDRTGHLSNEESKELLAEIRHERLSHVILAHLSETNNTASKALNVVGEALNQSKTRLTAARQDICGEILKVGG
jgi:phosphoribosyl 1,2-cyclic phosphodiesterase